MTPKDLHQIRYDSSAGFYTWRLGVFSSRATRSIWAPSKTVTETGGQRINLCTTKISFVSISDAVMKLIGRLNAFDNSSLNPRVTVVVHDNALYIREQPHFIFWVVALQEHIRGKTTIDLPDDL
jgi:hypothetical protein